MNKKRQVLVWVILSAIFLFSRLLNSNLLPLFSDEAYVIARAWEIWQTGNWLSMLKYTTQPVFVWLVALFIKLPLFDVFAARLVNTLFGLSTALLLAWAAEKFIHRQAKWIAFLLMMLLPFSFFYDRTALFESGLLSAISLAVFLPAAGLPLAIMIKQTAWLAIPLVVMLNRKNRRLVFAALFMSIAIPLIVWLVALGNWEQVKMVLVQTSAPIEGSANFKINLLRAKLWLISYVTFPILLLALLGLAKEIALFAKKQIISPLLIVGLWSIAILIFEAKAAVIFYPRYLYPILLGIVLLASSAGWELFNYIKKFRRFSLRAGAFLICSIAVLYIPVKSDYKLITSPQSAPIAAEDHFQFFEDWTSGSGSDKLLEEITKFLQSNRGRLTVYVEEENSYFVTLNRENMQNYEVRIAEWLHDPLVEIPQSVLNQKGEVWFVRNRHPDIPKDWSVILITNAQKSPNRSVFLYRISR